MKQAILTVLSCLIHSLKQESVRYHSLILPLIRSSVEPGSVSYHLCVPDCEDHPLTLHLCTQRRLLSTSLTKH